MSTQRLRITGMTCGHCARTVEDALNALPGVKAQVFLLSGDRRDPGFRGPQHRATLAGRKAKGFGTNLMEG
jgi:mercuric reductase